MFLPLTARKINMLYIKIRAMVQGAGDEGKIRSFVLNLLMIFHFKNNVKLKYHIQMEKWSLNFHEVTAPVTYSQTKKLNTTSDTEVGISSRHWIYKSVVQGRYKFQVCQHIDGC